jgi:nicotinamidase-related amidase
MAQPMDAQSSPPTGSVLIVVDMQACYLNLYKDQEYARRKIECVNRAISEARGRGMTVIFVEHEFAGFLTRMAIKLLMKGAGIRGCDGFPTDPRIDKSATDPLYLKFRGDLFSVDSLVGKLNKDGVSNILLAGQDGNYCIQESARGGKRLGYDITVLDSGVATNSEKRWRKEKAALESEGIRIAPTWE